MTRFTRRIMKGGLRIKKSTLISYVKTIGDSLNDIVDQSSKLQEELSLLNKALGITERQAPVGDMVAYIKGHRKITANTTTTGPLLGGRRRTRRSNK